ncbi:hypothetical protein BGZ49_001574 [Haplosporangium sp. Z 27]|nr:hypothetical protein BGZ49_001574 [Haplosporangium sp. Z 27]
MSDSDVISKHSDTLCQFFNLRYPEIVLSLARSHSKQNVPSAYMVQVRENGLDIECQDEQGSNFRVSVPFPRPVHSLSAVKEIFLEIGERAEEDAPTLYLRQIPGQEPGWRTYWPNWNWVLITLATGVLSFTYIAIFPDTKILPFQWILDFMGIDLIHTWLEFAFFLHAFQTVTAIYLMKRVSKYKFTLVQTAIWIVCVQGFGIGSMLKLLPIVYNSKFVSDEIDGDFKRNLEV